tara:strand:+ start:59 stop:1114 length:1056 start_codon:yes stop_codon:yes gene_type:complete
MPSIEEGIASLKSLSDAKDLEDRVLSLKMLLEEGIITQDEADQRLKEFKRNRGMANGGEIKDGIATFIPHMRNGGTPNLNNLSMDYIINAIVQIESSGGKEKFSRIKGKDGRPLAYGVTMVKPSTARDPAKGVPNIFDVADKFGVKYKNTSDDEIIRLLMIDDLAIDFSKGFLGYLFTKFENPLDAVLAYNQGETGVKNFIQKGRNFEDLGFEAKNYVNKFLKALGTSEITPTMLKNTIFPVSEPKKQEMIGLNLPPSFSLDGLNFLKSDDEIQPFYLTEPQTRPTEIVEQLGLPGDMLRDAEIERKVAMNPSLVERAKPPLTRSFMIEEEEDSPIVTSSLPPLQRPFGIN